MPSLRLLTLLFILLLALSGLSACTRERPPWPETNPFENGYAASASFEASPGETLPRFTPHVTSPPSITTLASPPAPPTIEPPAPTPTPSPSPTPPTPAPIPTSAIYTVQPGDTLYDIARKHHVSLSDLARINHITDPTTIRIGQQLLIP